MTVTAARIVPMTPAHIDALMPYERAMFGSEAWTRSGYRGELADPHRTYVAAEADGTDADGTDADETGGDGREDRPGVLLGWAGIRVLADEAEVLTVGVVPEARRTGLGRRLLAELLAAAVRQHVRDVYLEVRVDNDAARTLYRSEGFKEVGVRRGYYEHGRVDGIIMHRTLAPATGERP
ncbi:ribosomal protein S18-alanine N-acetyltransferase [uncultured Jatrophihabitans sp.]|uniref:ribosomal protein S18-alanine N-acetyltransferase n=1 Tax=uncultured Jatrophihabitans sp. TaxID=1610747 RepID=UPI0035CBFE3C